MRRVRTVVTGVEGTPYYINGYFDQDFGSTDDVIDAWGEFCLPAAVDGKLGSSWLTEGEVPLIDPGTGDIVSVEFGTPRLVVGSTDYDLAPRQSQALIRWRTGVYFQGREVRGRTNIPLQSQTAANNDGNLNAVVLSAYNTRAQLMAERVDVKHVVWSKSNGQWQETQSGSCWDQFATLRSRRD